MIDNDQFIDWDEAFDNFRGSDPNTFLAKWVTRSKSFLENNLNTMTLCQNNHYGVRERESFDLFELITRSPGTIMYVHRGYWMRTGREHWSFIA